jgi:hypothetical protein
MSKDITRREFVASTFSAAAISSLASSKRAIAGTAGGASSAATAAAQPDLATEAPFTDQPSWKDQGVLNLAHSPYAKLHNVPVRAVTVEHGFWGARREVNVTQSIPTMRDQLESHGRMDNFRRLEGKSTAPPDGRSRLRFSSVQMD